MPWRHLVVPKSQIQPRETSSIKHEVHPAGSRALHPGWQPSSAHKRPLLCARRGPCVPMQPSTGGLPHPTALAHIPQEHQRLLRSADFGSGRELGERRQFTSMMSTVPGGHGAGHVLLFHPRRKEEAPCKRTSLLGGRNTSVVSYHSPQSRKGPSEFPAGHQGGGSSHGKDCVSSAVHLYTNHRAVACFRRRLEAGLQLTFMYSSTCSRCSFNNASLQFIASHLIAFAVSSILWPLNYVATDWSWGTAALMLALPSCRTKRSCSKAGGGGPRRCRSDGVMRGGMYSWLGDGHAEDGGLEQTREQGRVCRSTKAG